MSLRASRPASIFAVLLLASGLAAAALPAGCAQEAPCQFNSDCAVGYCQDGVCKKNCVDASRDCPSGYICNDNAQCVPGTSGSSSSSSSSGTGGSTSSSSSGGPSSSSSSSGMTTTSSSSSTSASSTSGAPGSKQELELCGSSADCASGLCRLMRPGGVQRCTRNCGSTSQCMTGTICETVGSEQYCVADDTGRPCSSGPNCNFACVQNQHYCTKQCNTGADCPNGYGCQLYAGQKVCVQAEAPCADGSECTVACDTDPSLYVGGCTTQCTSPSDCPQRAAGLTPWSCNGGYCSRPSDVHGPLPCGYNPAQYVNDCQGNVVNVCNDGFNIDFDAFTVPNPPNATCGATQTSDGAPSDSCVDSCRYQGGCPFGFTCVARAAVGSQTIGLCMPTGSGEIGAPCVHDSQCAFGYCAQNVCSRDCTVDGLCPGGGSCVATPGSPPPIEGKQVRRCQ